MIYIHIPFCHRKCTYCAFYSKPLASTTEARLTAAAYVDALVDEMRRRRDEQAHPIHTIYIGGGTPSLLPLGQMARVVGALRKCFDLSQLEEATIECNPEDLTQEYLLGLKEMGLFNRLSIGLQSLDDEMLRLIGRRHTAQQAVEAVERAYSVGFHNISVDFMYGLPQMSQLPAFDFRLVNHVSAYALTVEEGTALAVQVRQGRVSLPGDDELVRQYYAMREHLAKAGFEQYEVSNYCRLGYHSRHNSRYWNRTPYLGLGAAAHSFDGSSRRWNVADVKQYIATQAFEEETLTDRDAYNELLMTALRTTAGLSLADVPERCRSDFRRKMQRYVDCGWIKLSTPHSPHSTLFQPTAEGLLHADGMAADLFEV